MAGVGWIMQIILGGLAGWVAEKIMKSDMGLFANILIGIVGALVLNFILRQVNVVPPEGSWLAQGLVAIVGACILIFVWRLVRGRRA